MTEIGYVAAARRERAAGQQSSSRPTSEPGTYRVVIQRDVPGVGDLRASSRSSMGPRPAGRRGSPTSASARAPAPAGPRARRDAVDLASRRSSASPSARDVIPVDMPGFGDSPLLDEPRRPGRSARRSRRCAREIGVERPHVAGNSLGGWVALEMAKADGGVRLPDLPGRPLAAAARPAPGRHPQWAKRLRPLVGAAARNRALREAMLRSTVGRPENVPLPEARAMIAAWIDAPGYEAANDEMRRYVCEDLDRVAVPTTIAWGELDRLVGPPRPERRPPDSRFIKLEGCGHTPELGRARPDRRSAARDERCRRTGGRRGRGRRLAGNRNLANCAP